MAHLCTKHTSRRSLQSPGEIHISVHNLMTETSISQELPWTLCQQLVGLNEGSFPGFFPCTDFSCGYNELVVALEFSSQFILWVPPGMWLGLPSITLTCSNLTTQRSTCYGDWAIIVHALRMQMCSDAAETHFAKPHSSRQVEAETCQVPCECGLKTNIWLMSFLNCVQGSSL